MASTSLGVHGTARVVGLTRTAAPWCAACVAASSCSTVTRKPGTRRSVSTTTGTPPASVIASGYVVQYGRRADDLVARIAQRGEGGEHGVLAAVGHQHLAGRALCSRCRAWSWRRWPRAARADRRPACTCGSSGRGRRRPRPRRCWPGVGKSGSPAPKPMTFSPAAFSALALASTARVADSAMAARRADVGSRSSSALGVAVPALMLLSRLAHAGRTSSTRAPRRLTLP